MKPLPPLPGLNYSSPHSFSMGQRVMLSVGSFLLASAFRAVFSLCRWEVRDVARDNDLRCGAGGPVIFALWHESMALGAHHFRNMGFYTLTSYSYDGEFAARVVRRFGQYALRGSSTRGGSEGLRDLVVAVAHRTVGVTLDGPTGPRRQAKPGVAILAARSKAAIMPLVFVPARAKRLHSWDRFPLPLPFSRVVCALGDPIPPPAGDTPAEIEPVRLQAEQALNALHERIEAEVNADIG